jgi:hypothetical protein
MPVDPAQESHLSCATCSRLPKLGGGHHETWYKMAGQTFCGACACDYAIDGDYLMPEEIDADPPRDLSPDDIQLWHSRKAIQEWANRQ